MESGGRAALPVFREIVLKVYREKFMGPAPRFPVKIEENIDGYLRGELPLKLRQGSLMMEQKTVPQDWSSLQLTDASHPESIDIPSTRAGMRVDDSFLRMSESFPFD